MNKKEENAYVHIKVEEDDYYSNDDLYNIKSWGADLSFRELITMYKEEEMIKPEMQRNYVWDKSEASRFIESLLLGLPVPSIFLAKTDKEHKLIVDGYQRIMTVYDYVETGIFSGDNKTFKLTNSEKINERWRGKAFNELNGEEQRRIKSTTIHTIIFEQAEPKDGDTSFYQIFERINTSGRTLLPQEIRNCIYHQQPLNSLLIELNKKEIWRELYGLEKTDSRMRDIEFILRFFALTSEELQNKEGGQISLKKWLNDFMNNKDNNTEEKITKFRKQFERTMNYISNNIGIEAFNNISFNDNKEHIINRFHPTIFDAIAISTWYFLQNKDENYGNEQNDEYKNLLKRKKRDLLRNNDFETYITKRTTNVDHIKGRINLAVRYLYGEQSDE